MPSANHRTCWLPNEDTLLILVWSVRTQPELLQPVRALAGGDQPPRAKIGTDDAALITIEEICMKIDVKNKVGVLSSVMKPIMDLLAAQLPEGDD